MKFMGKIDKPAFFITIFVYMFIFCFVFWSPEVSGTFIKGLLEVSQRNFGFFYVIVYAFTLIIMLFIAFGPYGSIRLSKNDEKPDFSFFSWMGMLVGAGIGTGLAFYAVAEPIMHFLLSPFQENATAAAAAEAMKYTFYHWGFLPWGIYGIVGLCMSYFIYRRDMPSNISSTFLPMLGDKVNGLPGKVINTIVLITVVCGISLSLGTASTQFLGGLNAHYGVSKEFGNIILVTGFIGIIATISSMSGVEKAIRYISDLNMYIVFFFLAFLFVVGHKTYMIQTFFETIGALLGDLPRMLLFLDNNKMVENKVGYDWVRAWTIMYWPWWATFAPFVGTFLARISKGRTIREFCLATVFVPSLLCFTWFAFFGGEAIYMSLFEGRDVAEVINSNVENSLYAFLTYLPISAFTIPLAMALVFTLIVTSVNSGTYVAGQFTSGGEYTPTLSIRAFWGVFIVLNALAFLKIGGIKTLLDTALIMAFPFMIMTVLMIVNLIMAFKKWEEPKF